MRQGMGKPIVDPQKATDIGFIEIIAEILGLGIEDSMGQGRTITPPTRARAVVRSMVSDKA